MLLITSLKLFIIYYYLFHLKLFTFAPFLKNDLLLLIVMLINVIFSITDILNIFPLIASRFFLLIQSGVVESQIDRKRLQKNVYCSKLILL